MHIKNTALALVSAFALAAPNLSVGAAAGSAGQRCDRSGDQGGGPAALPGALPRLRPDPGGREAFGKSRLDGISRDAAQMDGGGRDLVDAQTSPDIPPAEIAPRIADFVLSNNVSYADGSPASPRIKPRNGG